MLLKFYRRNKSNKRAEIQIRILALNFICGKGLPDSNKMETNFYTKKAPMLGAFKMSYLVYFVMLLYNSIFVIPSLEDRSLG